MSKSELAEELEQGVDDQDVRQSHYARANLLETIDVESKLVRGVIMVIISRFSTT